METVLHWMASIPVWVAYLIAFALPMLEASTLLGMVVPGETAMIAAGALSAVGRASFWGVLACGVTGAILGDTVGYFVGKRWGEQALRGMLGKILGRERWRVAKDHLRRRGFLSIVLSRFAPALRSVVPGAAGTARMPYRKFLAANALGGLLWATGSVGLGWIAGSSLRRLHEAHLVLLGIGLAIVLAAGLVGWRKLGRRSRERYA